MLQILIRVSDLEELLRLRENLADANLHNSVENLYANGETKEISIYGEKPEKWITFSDEDFNKTFTQQNLFRIFSAAQCQVYTITPETQRLPIFQFNMHTRYPIVPIIVDRRSEKGNEMLEANILRTIEHNSKPLAQAVQEKHNAEEAKKYKEDLTEKIRSLVQNSVNELFKGMKYNKNSELLKNKLIELFLNTQECNNLRRLVSSNYTLSAEKTTAENRSLIAMLTSSMSDVNTKNIIYSKRPSETEIDHFIRISIIPQFTEKSLIMQQENFKTSSHAPLYDRYSYSRGRLHEKSARELEQTQATQITSRRMEFIKQKYIAFYDNISKYFSDPERSVDRYEILLDKEMIVLDRELKIGLNQTPGRNETFPKESVERMIGTIFSDLNRLDPSSDSTTPCYVYNTIHGEGPYGIYSNLNISIQNFLEKRLSGNANGFVFCANINIGDRWVSIVINPSIQEITYIDSPLFHLMIRMKCRRQY